MTDNHFLVLGSGMMGSAIAFDLAQSNGVRSVTLADADLDRAVRAAAAIPGGAVRACRIDVNDSRAVLDLMKEHSVVIGAVSYRVNASLTALAIEAGVHFCDLGGNDDIVRDQLALNEAARARGVLVVPNCGLAPGLVNIIAAKGAEPFERVDTIRMRVGGLPQHPQPPLNYQIVFSVEGLLNEYSGRSAVLRDGMLTYVNTMTEVEELDVPPLGKLEAFHTSGGASFLPKLLEGKVRELDYKTIRYPGHCDIMRTLMEVGFTDATPMTVGNVIMTERELFAELLKRRLPSSGPDLFVLLASIDGILDGKRQCREFRCVDYFDEKHNITAMMRGTAYPTSLIAQQISGGLIPARGVLLPEQCVPLDDLLAGLRARGMEIEEILTGEDRPS